VLTGILKGVVHFLINPLNMMAMLLLAAGIAAYLGRRRWSGRILVGTLVLFLLTASRPFPELLVGYLENQYQPLHDLEALSSLDSVHVLVLGGGHTADPDLPATGQLSTQALQRLTEGLRIHRQLPQSRLIVSGYGNRSSRSQAEILRQAALELGAEPERISIQAEPSNTEEEARIYREKFGNDLPLILVTSAAHMPRAMYLFRQAGFGPVPAPAGYLVRKDPEAGYRFTLFSADHLKKVQAALHEYIGMRWARR
jgi:uncharacterized SAM-binding protein YcdF (DUF218 family)